MSDAWSQEAMERNGAFVANSMDLAIVFSCYALVCFAGIAMLHMEPRWKIKIPMSFLGYNLAGLWFKPINLYLYRDMTLPAWLKDRDGQLVRVMDKTTCNVLDHARLLNGEGGWQCSALSFKTWRAHVAGPQGWKYLFPSDPSVQVILSFMAFSVLYVAGVAYWLARERAARRRAEKLEDSGSTDHELGESEKQ